MFSQSVITCFVFLYFQTSHISSEILTNCHPNIDIRGTFDDAINNQSFVQNKKPHAQILSYDDVAYAFLSTANLALKFARDECREDICMLATTKADINEINDIAVAYTALYNLPYGLRLLLCSNVIIRNIVTQEVLFADGQHENKIQTARTKSLKNKAYKWRFEHVDGELNRLQFRIRNVKTDQYLVADRKFSMLSDTLRRIVMTDSKKSDIWELKMMTDLNGNFNKFMIMNVPLGEYLYAARGFCYDNISNVKNCSTRPLFTWEYKTLQEAYEDEYNKFIIDEYALD